MEPAAKKPVRVTIFHQQYALLTQGDPREVEAVAQTVDDLMVSIASKAPTADSTRIAVLACLELADKLRSLEQKTAQLNLLLGQLVE